MQTQNDLTKHVLYFWNEYRQSCFTRYSLLGACGVYWISLTINAVFLDQRESSLCEWFGGLPTTRDDSGRCNCRPRIAPYYFIQPLTVLYIWKSWGIFDTRADHMGDHGKRVVSARWRSDFTLHVREFLNEVFPSLWILCGSATSPSSLSWPSCNPDFTTPSEILWGILKEQWLYVFTNIELRATNTDALTAFNRADIIGNITKGVMICQALCLP